LPGQTGCRSGYQKDSIKEVFLKKVLLVITAVLFLVTASVSLRAEDAADGPKITGGVNFYLYTFFWNNTDFNQKDYESGGQTVKGNSDSYNYNYGHGSFYLKADWGKATLFTRWSAWGQFGMHSVFGVPADPATHLVEGYVEMKDLIGPFSLKVGKIHMLYGEGLACFDGVEEGQTGFLLSTSRDKFSLDLFYRKTQDNGGWGEMGFSGFRNPAAITDWNSWGAYATINLDKFTVSPYFFHRNFGKDKPMWLGADVHVNLIDGLAIKAEFVKMFGDNAGIDYTGSALVLKGDYTATSGMNFGAAYGQESGDNSSDGKNSTYESVMSNPYTNGYYKGWVGLGPAHLTSTPAAFSLQAPFAYMMSNITWLNGHVGTKIKNVSLRLDFFKYGKQKVVSGSKDLGYEIAGLLMTNLKGINFGATMGIWMPGDHISKVLGMGDDSRYGGYIFFAKSFDFKLN